MADLLLAALGMVYGGATVSDHPQAAESRSRETGHPVGSLRISRRERRGPPIARVLVMGRSEQPWRRRLLARTLVARMVREARDFDLHIVSPEVGRELRS